METGRALEQAPEERRVLIANDEHDLIDRHRRALQEAASLTDAQLLYVGDGRAPRRLAESARLSCGVCSGSRTEQWKSGEDLLQMHHLARYELGDGESDDLGRTVDVGDHAARFRSAEATEIGAQAQLDLVRVDRVDVKVDCHLGGADLAEPVE